MDVSESRVESEPEPKEAERKESRLRRELKAWGVALLIGMCGLLGSGFAVTYFGGQTYRWRAFDVRVGIRPAATGETRIVLTPLGEVRARTHSAPVALEIGLVGISVDKLKALAASPPPKKALELEFEKTARKDLRDFGIRQIGLGALGALLVPALLRGRRARYYVTSILMGGAFVALVFYGTIRTFNKDAFDSPIYTGSLRQADWVIGMAKEAFANAETLSQKLKRVADNVNVLYGRINETPGLAADVDTIKVLHISDIHNNPAAVDFVLELAHKTRVDLVINTGDLTDFGLPVETQLTRNIGRLGMPYLFVAGNHDSQATVASVRAASNSYILNGQPLSVAGLSILGAPDPSSARPGAGDVNTADAALAAAGARLAADFANTPVKPDIVCVHNPKQADPLVGRAPLILCGHTHRAGIEVREGTVICNAGSTGAAGTRYFETRAGQPLTAAILAFARHPAPRLLFIDEVMLDPSLGSYSISRRTFNRAGPPVPPTKAPQAPAESGTF